MGSVVERPRIGLRIAWREIGINVQTVSTAGAASGAFCKSINSPRRDAQFLDGPPCGFSCGAVGFVGSRGNNIFSFCIQISDPVLSDDHHKPLLPLAVQSFLIALEKDFELIRGEQRPVILNTRVFASARPNSPATQAGTVPSPRSVQTEDETLGERERD